MAVGYDACRVRGGDVVPRLLRLVVAVGAVAALGVSAGCVGGSSGAGSLAKRCARKRRPSVPPALRSTSPPRGLLRDCRATEYAGVVGTLAWGNLPGRLRARSPNLQVWQTRSLLYACDRCGVAGFGLRWVRRHHPGWVMQTQSGAEIHPQRHPKWVLLNFTSPKYQLAWEEHVRRSLERGGWTGVNLVDANNDPGWTDTPVNPSTSRPMTDEERRVYLARAMALIRDGLKIHGYGLMAENGLPTEVVSGQIDSTDAVSLGGFAGLRGDGWLTLLHYYQAADTEETGVYLWEPTNLPESQRVYALASYLLIATNRRSAYGGPFPQTSTPGTLNVGVPPDTLATHVGQAWVRRYPNGVVAVNPSPRVAHRIPLNNGRTVNLRPDTAIIAATGQPALTGAD